MTNPPSPPALPASTATPPAAPEFQPPASKQDTAPPPASPSRPAAPAVRPFRVRQTAGQSTPSTAPGQAGSPPSSAGELLDPLAPGANGTTRSSGEPATLKLDKSVVKELARGLVLTATEVIHEMLVKSEPGKHAELWIANDAEQKAIGDPLASITVRHGGGVPGSPDVLDLVKAGVGLATYGIRHAKTAISIRRQAKLEARRINLDPERTEPAAAAA